jgi:hypothetical protein
MIARSPSGALKAELRSPSKRNVARTRWDELVEAGVLHVPMEPGDPFEDWPDIGLPPGTARELIDADRGET